MRVKRHIPGIAVLLGALIAFASMQVGPAFAWQDRNAANIAPASMLVGNVKAIAISSSTEQLNELFGLPWNSLPFVTPESQDGEQGASPCVTVSKPIALTDKFSSPEIYQGRYFSTTSVTGASINANSVVAITLPQESLNHSDDEVEHLLEEIDARRKELQLPASTSNKIAEYCASHTSYRTQILNLAIIQSCLDYARDHYEPDTLYRIVLPAGTYELGAPALNECLHIYSNTWLDMTAGTKLIHLSRKACMMRNSKASIDLSGYEDHDIILDGGTWVGLDSPTTKHDEIAICHAKNVVVRNAVFDGCSGAHHLELVGVSGATVSGCEFKGYTGSTAKEAIQLDITGPASASSFKKSDYTTTRNVVVWNNSFHDLSRGIGTHYAYIGYLNSEILIQNNSFNRLKGEAILLCSFKNVAIVRNAIQNCPQAIHILPAFNNASRYAKTGEAYKTCGNYLIEGNTISTTGNTSDIWAAITIYGNKVGSTTYGLKNALLRNNVVNACNIALTLSRTSGITASGESYCSINNYCTLVHKAAVASFSNSSFKSLRNAGISAQTECALTLYRCTMGRCSAHGLSAIEASVSAASCSFTRNGRSGISASESNIALQSCKTSKNGQFGLYASESSLVIAKGSFQSNARDGMRLLSSTVSVSRAKSTSNKGCGIRAKGSALRAKKVTLSKNKSHGMLLQRTKASLKSCTSKLNRKHGICLTGKSSIKPLRKCTLSRNKGYGLYGGKKSKVAKQSKNKYRRNAKGSFRVLK